MHNKTKVSYFFYTWAAQQHSLGSSRSIQPILLICPQILTKMKYFLLLLLAFYEVVGLTINNNEFLTLFLRFFKNKRLIVLFYMLKQELILQLVTADILFIKYTLSNTIYQIPFIKYPLLNILYQIPFIKYLLSNTHYQIPFIKNC